MLDDIVLNSSLEMKLRCRLALCGSTLLFLFIFRDNLESNGFILFSTDDAVALNEFCMLDIFEKSKDSESDCSEEETFEKARIKLGFNLLSFGGFLEEK